MRYDKKQKQDVVDFVVKHNAEKGRGGQAAANEKFGVSPISIANWLTAAGVELPGKGGRKQAAGTSAGTSAGGSSGSETAETKTGRVGRPKGSKNAVKSATKATAKKAKGKGKGGRRKGEVAAGVSTTGGSSLSAKIQRLAELDTELQKLQAEFDELRNSL